MRVMAGPSGATAKPPSNRMQQGSIARPSPASPPEPGARPQEVVPHPTHPHATWTSRGPPTPCQSESCPGGKVRADARACAGSWGDMRVRGRAVGLRVKGRAEPHGMRLSPGSTARQGASDSDQYGSPMGEDLAYGRGQFFRGRGAAGLGQSSASARTQSPSLSGAGVDVVEPLRSREKAGDESIRFPFVLQPKPPRQLG
jgi:hypothetical protein